MDYTEALQSGSSQKIRKAAQAISKNTIHGFCLPLLNALTSETEKPKAWKTQCQLIRTIATTDCIDAVSTLRSLTTRKFESTTLYKELGFAIFVLKNLKVQKLTFLYQVIERDNVLLVSGACSGLLFKESIPNKEDIRKIIAGVEKYTENEGSMITPRCYIAAVCHLWPREETKEFLQSCKNSRWPNLVAIAGDALKSKRSQIQLI